MPRHRYGPYLVTQLFLHYSQGPLSCGCFTVALCKFPDSDESGLLSRLSRLGTIRDLDIEYELPKGWDGRLPSFTLGSSPSTASQATQDYLGCPVFVFMLQKISPGGWKNRIGGLGRDVFQGGSACYL